MFPVDLITGFLGVAKSTLLLRYALLSLRQGNLIGNLLYHYGAVNVDMPLLQELREANCELEMLAGGCDADCHRRRFRTKLIAMSMSGYDRVLIEPSGVFDMDEFFDTLCEPPLDKRCEPGNVIAVVDAGLEEDAAPEEDFFLASQVSCAGCVLLSRCRQTDAGATARTLAHLRRAAEQIHGPDLPDERILAKDWDELDDADWARLASCGSRPPDYMKTIAGDESGFQALSFLDLPLEGEALREKTAALFRERRYGRILRVKGFFREGAHGYQLNATADTFRVTEVPPCRGALLVIGSGLDEDAIGILLTGHTPEHHIL